MLTSFHIFFLYILNWILEADLYSICIHFYYVVSFYKLHFWVYVIVFDKLVLLSSFFFMYFAAIIYISCTNFLQFDLGSKLFQEHRHHPFNGNIFGIGRYFNAFNYNLAIKSELLLKHRLLLCFNFRLFFLMWIPVADTIPVNVQPQDIWKRYLKYWLQLLSF